MLSISGFNYCFDLYSDSHTREIRRAESWMDTEINTEGMEGKTVSNFMSADT